MHVGTETFAEVAHEATPRTAHSFLDAQRVASQRIGFSVTQACPLRCEHCSVEASPQLASTTYTLAFAERVAAQLPALREAGIKFVDFTGGEPTLARQFVRKVSADAERLGMTCGIVSAAHWATNPRTAHAFLAHFAAIGNWDLSTDIYHLPFVPVEYVLNAYQAIRDRGGSAQIRIAHHEPITRPEAELISKVYDAVGRNISFQPIGPVGRGRAITVDRPVPLRLRDTTPCPSTGLLIRSDGMGAPCCAPLSHRDSDSPLFLGNAFADDLVTMVTRWRLQPLLQTIRVWGFEALGDWLLEANEVPRRHFRDRACDECVSMLGSGETAKRLNSRASELAHRIDLAIALKRDFGETWMADSLQAEARRYLAGETCVWN